MSAQNQLFTTAVGQSLPLDFQLDVGVMVSSVVPQPVTRTALGLQQNLKEVNVYFSGPVDSASAQNPLFYQLMAANDTAGNEVTDYAMDGSATGVVASGTVLGNSSQINLASATAFAVSPGAESQRPEAAKLGHQPFAPRGRRRGRRSDRHQRRAKFTITGPNGTATYAYSYNGTTYPNAISIPLTAGESAAAVLAATLSAINVARP